MTWRVPAFSLAVLLLVIKPARAQFEDLEVKLTPASRAYCHILRFQRGWETPRLDDIGQRLLFGLERSDYEFRAEGLTGTKFFVAGFNRSVTEKNLYTTNRYSVDLANPAAPVLPVRAGIWDAAAVVPITRKSAFPPVYPRPNDEILKFQGFRYTKTGEIWNQDHGALVSPAQDLLVLLSDTPQDKPPSSNQDLRFRLRYPARYGRARVFFDIFDASTGVKTFTLEGTFSSLNNGMYPDEVLDKAGWVTNRFFIIPLGSRRDRCLVCDFGKPPARKGARP